MKKLFSRNVLLLICSPLTLLIFITSSLYASPPSVLPVFNNFWYTDARQSGSKANLCQPDKIDYAYSNKFDTLPEIKQYLTNNLPSHSDCTWQPLTLTPLITNMPIDFPSDMTDYQKIARTDGITSMWSTNCQDAHGQILDHREGIIYPSYVCSKGSIRYCSIDPSSCKCSQYRDISCLGDVVGRDLGSFGFSFLGHVGVTIDIGTLDTSKQNLSSEIIEVVKEAPVIRVQSLTDFKNAMPYWGAKYNLPQYPAITYSQVQTMAVLGAEQARFDPSYSFLWFWRPGGIVNEFDYNLKTMSWTLVPILQKAIFRCDAFVYYLYKKGAQMLIPYTNPMTPKAIYNSFLSVRDERPDLLTLHPNYDLKNDLFFLITTQDDLETQIKQIFAQSSLDINQADQVTYQYFNTTTVSRDEKINFLWELVQTYTSNNVKFDYLVGVLMQLKPTEIANNILTLYKQLQDNDEKGNLVTLMNYSIYYDTLQETQALTQTQLNGVIAFKKFLQQQLVQEKDQTLYQDLFFNNLNLSDKSQIDLVLQENSHTTSLTNNTKMLAEVWQSFVRTPNNIAAALITNKYNSSYATTVCFIIAQLPSNYFDAENKKIIGTYLSSNKILLTSRDARMNGCSYETALSNLSFR